MLKYPKKFPDKDTRISGIIVFQVPSDRILLLEGTNGKLDLPKGHVEEGETFLQGALRECNEETGLHHHHNLDVYPYHYVSVPSKKWLRFYLGYTPETEIDISDEHADYHWMTPNQAIRALGSHNQFSHVIEAMCAIRKNK